MVPMVFPISIRLLTCLRYCAIARLSYPRNRKLLLLRSFELVDLERRELPEALEALEALELREYPDLEQPERLG